MLRHHPAQRIRLVGPEAGDLHGDLDHLFLKEDHPVSFAQNLLQLRVDVANGLLPLPPGDVGLHHIALDRARPDERHARHHILDLIGPQACLERALRWAL